MQQAAGSGKGAVKGAGRTRAAHFGLDPADNPRLGLDSGATPVFP